MKRSRRSNGTDRRVAVVGGGLAGMAAALKLAENACQVDLLEQKHRLGGRVGSFRDPQTGEWIDNGMHVSMACCTNFLDFIRRTGCEDCFDRHRRLTFIGPGGETCHFAPWPWLPAPLHLLPGFARLRYLTLHERLSISRCLMRMARLRPDDRRGKTAGAWLRRQKQSQRTIDCFWSVVLVSALGDTVDRVALSAARKVFLDGFLRSSSGYEVLIPNVPLGEIFGQRVRNRLADLHVNIHEAASVRAIEMHGGGAENLITAEGNSHPFDALILAVPWTTIQRVLSKEQRALLHSDWRAERIEASAITAVHLWFDREITGLPHAALLGRTSQWIFRHPPPEGNSAAAFRYQVVVSASNRLSDVPREKLLEQVLEDLRSLFPSAGDASLVHHRIVAERTAVFSATPEGLTCRPGSATAVPNVCLAGDWIETGWPATMEGSIRSGYRAAGLVLSYLQGSTDEPVAEAKPSWLARLLFKRP